MDFSKDITGFLPPAIAKLFRDDAALKDLLIVLAEMDKAVNVARKNPAADKKLQEAFNDVAGLTPVLKTLLEKKGKVSFGDVPRYMGLLKNKDKYEALGDTFSDAFKAGDPVVIAMTQSMIANETFMAALKRVGPKLLPPEVQPLLQDKTIAADMLIIVAEMEAALAVACKSPETDKSLQEAFNDVAKASGIVRAYLDTGSVAPALITELALNVDKYRQSGQTLSDSYDAGNPVVITLAESLKKNEKILGAIKRTVPKAHGTLFKLEMGADGQGYAVELLSGNFTKFPLEKADYEEIKSAIAAAKNQPKPKGPSV